MPLDRDVGTVEGIRAAHDRFGDPLSSEVGDDLLTGAPLANLQASREAIRARAAGQCLPASIAMDNV